MVLRFIRAIMAQRGGLDLNIIAKRIFFVSEWAMSRPTRKFLLGGKFSMGLMCGVIISLGLFHGLTVP